MLWTPNNPQLIISNQRLERNRNQNPYINKHTTVISVLANDIINSSSVKFEFGKIFLQKADKQIKSLTATFENNSRINLVQNGVINQSPFTVSYTGSRLREVKFDIVYVANNKIDSFKIFN